jgi:hypothetical protein
MVAAELSRPACVAPSSRSKVDVGKLWPDVHDAGYLSEAFGAEDSPADAVNGIFDFDGAAWADRHHGFR